jgi:hypothetical protein
MRHLRLLRPLGFVALVIALTPALAAPAFGAPPAGRLAASDGSEALSWLTSAWKAVGCFLIPAGPCLPPGGATPTSDYGCSADPSGVPRCNPASLIRQSSEYGCSADPDGKPVCGFSG